jgi:zinc D-Ala-D-Ala carboxypeptidase
MKLSKNFTLHELTRSQTAKRYGIDNTPGPEHLNNLRYLCNNLLQPLRDEVGPVTISSGYRSKKVNKKVGGSRYSLHSQGCAADIDNVNLLDILCYIHYNLPYTELIAEYFPGGWVHAGLVKGREDEKKLKLKDDKHDYEIVTIEYIIQLYGGEK